MPELVTLETDRLVLRPFTFADAPRVQLLVADQRVATTTASIPHPYPDGAAEAWIRTHVPAADAGRALTWAVATRSDELVGAIHLVLEPHHGRAEMGYWIGHPYWGQGYATEAAGAVLAYAFGALDLNRVHASHLERNPASGRVLQKLGMTHEGRLRKHFSRDGHLDDIEAYGMLRAEYQQARSANPPEKPKA